MDLKPHTWRGKGPARLWTAALGAALLTGVTSASEARSPFGFIERADSARAGQNPAGNTGGSELQIGRWRTWVLGSGGELRPAPPPGNRSPQTAAELAELRQMQAQRTDATNAIIQYWNSGPATRPWTELTLSLIQQNRINPVRAARILGCVHTAMHDAVVAAWDAKYHYRRLGPRLLARDLRPAIPISGTPSYPSEHAAVAGAAATMLVSLFPSEAQSLADREQEACQSRLLAGANYRSDVEIGMAMGRAVGQKAIARAAADGSSAVYAGTPPSGPGVWTGPSPLEPLAGTWKPWIMTSGSQLRPVPPPAFGSAKFLAELEEVKRFVANPTPAHRAIALFWADGAGTVTPPGHWFQIAGTLIERDRLSTPQAARLLGLLGATVTDAAISCWDTKYEYWLLRPNQADPTIVTTVPTPPFPAYTSGHSTFSAASSEVLGYYFPRDAARLRAMADEAALSRIVSGIHYRSDSEVGLQVGRRLAALAIQRDRLSGR
jgi:membrane-associated phospholipid phosphatase